MSHLGFQKFQESCRVVLVLRSLRCGENKSPNFKNFQMILMNSCKRCVLESDQIIEKNWTKHHIGSPVESKHHVNSPIERTSQSSVRTRRWLLPLCTSVTLAEVPKWMGRADTLVEEVSRQSPFSFCGGAGC